MSEAPPPRYRAWAEGLAALGCASGDDEELRLRKTTLTIAVVTITLFSTAWVATYVALGVPVSAAIPFGYQLVSLAGLAHFARTKDFAFFRRSQLALMLVLPFLLQLSLGGFVNSSGVSLWSLVSAFGALFFYGPAEAVPWFIGFIGLTVVAGALDGAVAADARAIPDAIRIAFFVLNVSAVSLTAYLMLQYFVRQREAALTLSDELLHNILPGPIADRLKRSTGIIAEAHPAVTILFADVVDFTPFAERTAPRDVVALLDRVFTRFDQLAERHGLEKIKTIGDAYMVAGGLPSPRADHVEAVAEMALEMLDAATELSIGGPPLRLRIGMDSGPVIAGVIGRRKFIYDLWGDAVNTASRMESHGVADRIQVTRAVADHLAGAYVLEGRGFVPVKGKGELECFFLLGRRPEGVDGRDGGAGEAASTTPEPAPA